jgi:N-acetylglucosamine kinase-like BadF-type ATPase
VKISIYLGIDAGGTTMTAAAIDADGRLLAVHRGPGASAFAPPSTRASLPELLDGALRSVVAASSSAGSEGVRGIVIGLAGGLVRPDVELTVAEVVRSRGVDPRPLIVNDAETIFASGTSASGGCVLVAGTGAIALAVRDHRAVSRVDGHGWLLGDRGSAVWIGFEAVRSVLQTLDGRSRATTLVDAVPAALGELAGHPCARDTAEIVVTAHELPPAGLGRLAPLVEDHARRGDVVARDLLRSAARSLAVTLGSAVAQSGHPRDLRIVIGGSVAHDNMIVRRSLMRSTKRRWPQASVRIVRGGVAGAALWARRLDGHDHDDRLLHRVRAEIETSAIDVTGRK